jgi:hypothetical protein
MDYLIEGGGGFVAVDRESGGYPWITASLNAARFWGSLEEAIRYYSMFPDRAKAEGWRLYQVTIKRELCIADGGEFL